MSEQQTARYEQRKGGHGPKGGNWAKGGAWAKGRKPYVMSTPGVPGQRKRKAGTSGLIRGHAFGGDKWPGG